MIAGISCQGYEEPDGNDACKEAGYSIANRTVTCGGDRDTGNARYRALFDQYTCVAEYPAYHDPADIDPYNEAPPPTPGPHEISPGEAFSCGLAIRAITCDQAQRNGDSILSWLGSSPNCAKIFEGPGIGAGGASGMGGMSGTGGTGG